MFENPSKRSALLIAAPTVSLLWVHGGAAQTEIVGEGRSLEGIRVTYSATPDCPNEAAFRSEIRDRVSGDWETSIEEPMRTIDVAIGLDGGRHVAKLTFADRSGNRMTRTIRGERCETVSRGAALISAIAIESGFERVPEGDPEPATAEPPPASATPPPEPVSAPEPPGSPTRGDGSGSSPDAERTALAGLPLAVGLGARFSVSTGLGPGAALGPGGFFSLGTGSMLGEIAVDVLSTPDLSSAGGRATFRLIAGRLQVCAFDLLSSKATALMPCILAEAGALRGEGLEDEQRIVSGYRELAPWAASGLALRLSAVTGPLLAVVELNGRIPVTRPTFYFTLPRENVHEVPIVVAGATAGLGLRF